MSKHDVFMPLMIGDFLRDTMRLDTEQQGMYLLLLIEYWSKGPLPDDPRILQKICKISGHIFSKKFPDIRQIFLEKDGHLHHPGTDAEKARSLALHERKSSGGKKGMASRWGAGDNSVNGKTITEQLHSHSHSHRDSNESLSRAEFNTEQVADAPAPGEGEAVAESGEAQGGADRPAATAEAAMVCQLLALPFEIDVDPQTAQSWLNRGFSAADTDKLGRLARNRKPTGPIPLKYLETIVDGEFLAAKPEKRNARRSVPAAKLSPSEIVLAACRAEQQAEAGIFDGSCEVVH